MINIVIAKNVSLFLFLQFLIIGSVHPQLGVHQLNSGEKQELIEKISSLLKEYYVFPDLGAIFGEELLSKFEMGEFDGVSDPKKFGEEVTAALRELTKDKHLNFRLIAKTDPGEEETASLHHPVRYFRLGEKEHLGIFRLDWIDNEIGYLDYRRFYYHSEAKRMLLDAINFLAPAKAIIIDLRENQGGSGKFIPLLCSYFLPYPTQLTSTYYREDDITEEWWTYEQVEGKRLLDVPLFVLISNKTFSAAEYLAYDLKVRERATMVGEATGGGAHSVDLFLVGELFEIYIPTARAVNPVTGSNWEGGGIEPDVEVPSEKVLDTAVELAKDAAREYGKTRDADVTAVVEKMQRQLDETESLFEKGCDNEAVARLAAVFHAASQAGMLNEFFIDVLVYHYSSHRSYQTAIGILKKWIELVPGSSDAYESLAWAYYKQGDKTHAIKYFSEALELDKNNSVAKQMLKKLKQEKNKTDNMINES